MTEKELKHLFQDAKDVADNDKFPAMRIILLGNGGVSKEVELEGINDFNLRLNLKNGILNEVGKTKIGALDSDSNNNSNHIITFE